jgi:hypothetical protein
MIHLYATSVVEICGTKDAWSTESEDPHVPRTETTIRLEIQGNDTEGYHLIMSPEGFFVSDLWYETVDEALEDGLQLFRVKRDQWKRI